MGFLQWKVKSEFIFTGSVNNSPLPSPVPAIALFPMPTNQNNGYKENQIGKMLL